MESNMLITITTESDLSKANADLEALQDREKDIQMEMRKLQADYQKQNADIQANVKGREAQIAALDKLRNSHAKQQTELESGLKTTRGSIASLSKAINNASETIVKGATQTKKLVTELRRMKNELAIMEESGISPADKGFIELAVKAAQLEDQLGDTQQRIRALASDTKNLDAALNVGQGLAGGFMVATSAMALFGGENEELTKAFMKAQAALNILNGVKMVADVINKDSIATTVIGTAVENASTTSKIKNSVATKAQSVATVLQTKAENGSKVAKIASTVAQWALNSAMLANPVFWLLGGIGLIVGAFALFSSSAKKAAEAQKELNAAEARAIGITEARLKDVSDASNERIEDIQREINVLSALGGKEEEIRKLKQQIIDEELAANEKKKNAAFAELGLYDRNIAKANELKKTLSALNLEANQNRNMTIKLNGKDIEAKVSELVDIVNDELENTNKKIDIAKAITTDGKNLDAKQKILDAETANKKKERDDAYAKKRKEDIKAAEKSLQDVVIQLMKDGEDKEIAQIRLNYERKIAEIKGNSKAEVELRKKLAEQEDAEIKAIQLKYSDDAVKRELELSVLRAQVAEKGSAKDIALKKATLQAQSDLDIENIRRSTDNEEIKAERIKLIRQKLADDLAGIDKSEKEKEIEAATTANERRISEEKYAAEKILADSKSTYSQRKEARKSLDDLEAQLDDNKLNDLNAKYAAGLITEQEYQDGLFEIKQAAWDKEIEALKTKADDEKAIQQELFNFVSELGNILFDAKKAQIEQEMADLEHFYTTDVEAAKKNANLKFITEEELAAKQLELKRKQAIADKQQAAFNIALTTAQAVMSALVSIPPNVPLSLVMAATGAVQLAAVLAKPLPKYAKGKKAGGKGHFATVGELGAETMWIPDGAAVIPHNRSLDAQTFSDFNIPTFNIPEMPNVDSKRINNVSKWQDIDYDKIGKAVADNVNIKIPSQKHVSVNVNRDGVTVDDGLGTTTFLNSKFNYN